VVNLVIYFIEIVLKYIWCNTIFIDKIYYVWVWAISRHVFEFAYNNKTIYISHPSNKIYYKLN
jgi:hypothetical protein